MQQRVSCGEESSERKEKEAVSIKPSEQAQVRPVPGRWLVVCLYSLFLFFSAAYLYPIAQAAQTRGLGHVGIIFSQVVTGLLCLVIFVQAIRSLARSRMINLLIMLLVAVGFLLAFHSIHQPIEQFHFFQYGILGGLVFWALSRSVYTLQFYCTALNVVLVIGYIDELVQGFVPYRIYDLRDTGIDVLSAALGFSLCRAMDLRAPHPLHPAGRAKHGLPTTERLPLVDLHVFSRDLVNAIPLAVILLTNWILVTSLKDSDVTGRWTCRTPAHCSLFLGPLREAHLRTSTCELSTKYIVEGNTLDGFYVHLHIDPEEEDIDATCRIQTHPRFRVLKEEPEIVLRHPDLGILERLP